MISTTYSEARRNLAALLDRVANDGEVAIVKRRSSADVALISVDELFGLLETVHLLRSPANSRRLLTALKRAQTKTSFTMPLDSLSAALGPANQIVDDNLQQICQ